MSKLFEKLYDIMPASVQNLAVSLYGLKLYRREYGPAFREMLEQFEEMQWYSLERLIEYQEQKLRALIEHCYENVPYYKNIMQQRKLTPDDIRHIGDLNKLPILTRDDVRNNRDQLIARNFKRSQLIHGHTSGTTGSPLSLIWDNQICLMKNVVDWRQKRIAGIDPGDKMAFFLARKVSPLNRKRPPYWRHNYVLNHLFFSSWHLSPSNLPAYFDKLSSFSPKAVEGYPSTIYILARYLLSKNLTFPVKAVFTSSETLMPNQRSAIEKAFSSRLYDFFGMAERVLYATECGMNDGKHINGDFGIIEIPDANGRQAPPGQLGRIVATGLHNYAMPLIRYQTSDITAWKGDQCPCGRNFPLIRGITTKDEDIITTRDGRLISSSILNALTHHLTEIAEHQIVQEDRDHVVMNIVKGPGFSDNDINFLKDDLQNALGGGINVEIKFVDNIPRTAAGKYRWVISRVPLDF
jgi:phenylacetate-CoA ligase